MYKTVYKNMTIINGNKNIGGDIQDGLIVVDEKGILEYVGPQVASIPGIDLNADSIKTVDLTGLYVMPGLINAHAHFFSGGKPMNNFPPLLVKTVTWFLRTFVGKIVLRYIYNSTYKTAVNAGITTVRDMGSFYYNDIRCRDKYDSGKKIGPRVIASGSMITSTGGHGYEFPDRKVADSPWEDRKAVREHIIHQVDWIKICNTAGVSDARFEGEAGEPTMTVEEISAACDEAHTRNFMVATHCESTEGGIRRALEAGVDSIEHGAVIEPDMIELFKNNPKALRGYTSLVPTLSAFFIPGFAEKLKKNPANDILIKNTADIGAGCKAGLITAYANDITLGTGNDASVPRVPQYYLYKELLNFHELGGIPIRDVLHIATVDTSRLIGVDDETGTLDSGKSADFIVLDKNPTIDLRYLFRPKHVVVRGGHAIMKPKFKTYKNM